MSSHSRPTPICASPGHQRKPRRRGFTLIEMLVVVAILGLLMALIFPAMQGVMRRTESVRCLSNLRNIGTAILFYEKDHRRLPGPINEGQMFRLSRAPRSNEAHLVYALHEYLDLPDFVPGQDPREIPTFRCPANRRLMGDRAIVSYLANRRDPFPMGNFNAPSGDERHSPRSLWDLPAPSSTWLVMDGDRGPSPISTSTMYPDEVTHGRFRNVLFADGRVTAFPAELGRPPPP